MRADKSGHRKQGFTLLEVLLAVSILAVAFTVVMATFSVTTRAWRHGSTLLDEMHHGDFVMEQLVSALRSTAYFEDENGTYGFWLEKGHGRWPQDQISWVASGTAFMPPDEELARGLHRLMISFEENENGDEGFAVLAFPHLKDVEDVEEKPWVISTEVKGLECRIWDAEDEDWIDEWEFTNMVPHRVEITLYMDPLEGESEPVTLKRMVEIPVSPLAPGAAEGTPRTRSGNTAEEQRANEEDTH